MNLLIFDMVQPFLLITFLQSVRRVICIIPYIREWMVWSRPMYTWSGEREREREREREKEREREIERRRKKKSVVCFAISFHCFVFFFRRVFFQGIPQKRPGQSSLKRRKKKNSEFSKKLPAAEWENKDSRPDSLSLSQQQESHEQSHSRSLLDEICNPSDEQGCFLVGHIPLKLHS